METHWKNNFDYKFTGAYELAPGEEKTVTILKTCKEEVNSTDGTKKLCLVIYFKDAPKPMVLNKTNCKTIEKMYTPFVENWPGKRITVFAAKVKAFGEVVEALRIRPTVPKEVASIDWSKKINDCKTLEELGATWNLPGFPQKELFNLKETKKNELSKN